VASKLGMHRTNVVLHVANLIQNSVRERCVESRDLDVFGEIISRWAFNNGTEHKHRLGNLRSERGSLLHPAL
jgi:hypothetical protein